MEALCRAADRDPEELRASWEDARRARLKRYYPEPDGKPDDGPAKDTPPASRRKRIVAIVVAIAAVAALAGAGYFWLVIPESPAQKRFCPWRYVVTDGDPAPVRIADRPGANRRHIAKTYAPDEVFYAPEPAQVMNEMMRTVDGWVTQGDWIQRAPGECVLRPG